mmetsp:Transcript_20991/g.43151  ORF Transcript_20991/g.43151 Transcript_20991/m.43151 type:complete len:226 (-) Transcript_20991:212-889(-)
MRCCCCFRVPLEVRLYLFRHRQSVLYLDPDGVSAQPGHVDAPWIRFEVLDQQLDGQFADTKCLLQTSHSPEGHRLVQSGQTQTHVRLGEFSVALVLLLLLLLLLFPPVHRSPHHLGLFDVVRESIHGKFFVRKVTGRDSSRRIAAAAAIDVVVVVAAAVAKRPSIRGTVLLSGCFGVRALVAGRKEPRETGGTSPTGKLAFLGSAGIDHEFFHGIHFAKKCYRNG